MLAERERDKWDFAPPGGESYRVLTRRIGEWYEGLTRDTVVAAHGGGVPRADGACSGYCRARTPRMRKSAQGVVYVFADGKMARYG